jgi:hypothetical protein
MKRIIGMLLIVIMMVSTTNPCLAARVGIAVALSPELTEQRGSPYQEQFTRLYYDYLHSLYGAGNEIIPQSIAQTAAGRYLERDFGRTAQAALGELGADYMVLGIIYDSRVYKGSPNMFTDYYSFEAHLGLSLCVATAEMARNGEVAWAASSDMTKRASSRSLIEPPLQEYFNEMVADWPQKARLELKYHPSWQSALYPFL